MTTEALKTADGVTADEITSASVETTKPKSTALRKTVTAAPSTQMQHRAMDRTKSQMTTKA